MDAKSRKLRRMQLDQLLVQNFNMGIPETPTGGWIRAIRQALGMNYEVLGKRLGVSKQTAHQLERAESNGAITINRMRIAADALECDLVVLLVPRQPLAEIVLQRAIEASTNQVQRVSHSMAMEQQYVSRDRINQMVDDRVAEMIENGDQKIWE